MRYKKKEKGLFLGNLGLGCIMGLDNILLGNNQAQLFWAKAQNKEKGPK